MNILDPVVCRELPVIRKIIDDETWLEGERRGCWVPSDDPVVRENVCQVIVRIGAALREALMGRAETGVLVPVEPMSSDHHPHAA